MRVVAGLGNPGARYVWTRHNMGFMVVREIAERWRVPFQMRGNVGTDGAAALATAVVDGEEIRLVMPQTYMNRSASALTDTLESADADATGAGEDLIVVYDDVDLPPGALRIRRSGGAGGHRGVASIIETLGANFLRVRVGVGRPPEGVETADYVLAEMVGSERDHLGEVVGRAADAVECLLRDGTQAAMNRFNAVQETPPAS